MFKSYTRKSSAIQGAKRAGLDPDAVVQKDGQWGFYTPTGGLPKLSGGGTGGGGGGGGGPPNNADVVEAVYQNGLSLENAINGAALMVCNRLGSLLTDIRDVFIARDAADAAASSAAKLRQLEDDREKDKGSKASTGGLTSVVRNMGGMLDLVKMLSAPFIIGALSELDQFFGIISTAKEKFSEWGGKLQGFLDAVAELPPFKDNIFGAGIRNLIPIAAGIGLFALWKPGPIKAGLTALAKMFSWLGDNPAITGSKGIASPGLMAKFGRALGKIAIPITIITSLVETVEGAFAGYKNGGFMGAVEGAVDGLVNGLIGGLIDLTTDGIGWLLERFGIDGQRFKNFSFAKFLDELGGGLGILLFDLVEMIKETARETFKGFTDIWNSDQSLMTRIGDMIAYPYQTMLRKFQEEFGGMSVVDMMKKMLSMATGNHLPIRALEAASRPASPADSTGQRARRDPSAPVRSPRSRSGVSLAPGQQTSISSRMSGTAALEDEARRAGMTDAQIAYAYETDRLIGAPRGATLAQLKQESSFNNNARSPTGAVGISQFTNIGVEDVLFGRKARTADERVQRDAAKQSLIGDTDKGLEYHRRLMMLMQSRGDKTWQETMRAYNGDTKLERNGMQARDNYMARIHGFMGQDVGVTPTQRAATSSALVSATEASRAPSTTAAPAAVIAPVTNNNNVSNVTQNHLPNMSASTPVEFAPFVS